jgi:aspartate kinase
MKIQSIDAAIGVDAVQDQLVEEAKILIQDIRNDHVFAAQTSLRNPDLKKALCEDIHNECQKLAEYVVAARRFNLEVNSRSKDLVISFGEKLSCRFMTYMLRDRVSPMI